MGRNVWLTAVAGGALGLLLCLASTWPPWDPGLTGDRYAASLIALMRSSYPLYFVTGDVARHLPGHPVPVLLVARSAVVVLNWAFLGALAGVWHAGVLRTRIRREASVAPPSPEDP
jgi:hypothetical protein